MNSPREGCVLKTSNARMLVRVVPPGVVTTAAVGLQDAGWAVDRVTSSEPKSAVAAAHAAHRWLLPDERRRIADAALLLTLLGSRLGAPSFESPAEGDDEASLVRAVRVLLLRQQIQHMEKRGTTRHVAQSHDNEAVLRSFAFSFSRSAITICRKKPAPCAASFLKILSRKFGQKRRASRTLAASKSRVGQPRMRSSPTSELDLQKRCRKKKKRRRSGSSLTEEECAASRPAAALLLARRRGLPRSHRGALPPLHGREGGLGEVKRRTRAGGKRQRRTRCAKRKAERQQRMPPPRPPPLCFRRRTEMRLVPPSFPLPCARPAPCCFFSFSALALPGRTAPTRPGSCGGARGRRG